MTTPVDAHFHWYPRSVLERLMGREGTPRVERDGDGYVYVHGGGRIGLWPAWFDLDAGLALSDAALGDETHVINTAGVLSGLFDELPVEEGEAIATEWNEEMARVQRERPGRFTGTAIVPLTDTDAAVRLVDHAIGELGLRGVNLAPITADGPIDQARLEPFYDRVEQLGAPLIVHPTDLVLSDVLSGYDEGIQRSMGRLVDSSVTIMRLIFSGIMERHPDLKVVHTHGGGILPFQAGRLDKNARIQGLPQLPSVYLKRMAVDTVAPQGLTIRGALEFYGADRVLYGTDFPCWQPKAAVGVIDEAVPPSQRDDVMGGNAVAFFGL